jgi:hypothetical protein
MVSKTNAMRRASRPAPPCREESATVVKPRSPVRRESQRLIITCAGTRPQNRRYRGVERTPWATLPSLALAGERRGWKASATGYAPERALKTGATGASREHHGRRYRVSALARERRGWKASATGYAPERALKTGATGASREHRGRRYRVSALARERRGWKASATGYAPERALKATRSWFGSLARAGARCYPRCRGAPSRGGQAGVRAIRR